MSKANKLGDFAKNISLQNQENTPIQEKKNGVIKPIEKTFLLSIPEERLFTLKRLALDKKTSVRQLINSAIEEMYFK